MTAFLFAPGGPADPVPLAFAPPDLAWLRAHWRADPWVVALLALAALVYVGGVARARREDARRGRALAGPTVAFAAGLVVTGLAVLSPLDALTSALLSAHMVQYLLLTVAAPVLLVNGAVAAAAPPLPARWARAARALWARLTIPAVVGGLDVALLVGWHLPGPYQATVRAVPVRLAMQASVFAAGVLYWWAIRHPGGGGGAGHGRTLGSFLLTSLAGSAFGLALFSTAATPWYPIYRDRTPAWGVAPMVDQQFAGLVLGVLPEAFDVLPFVLLAAAWLRAAERQGRRAPAREHEAAPVPAPVPPAAGRPANTALLLILLALIVIIMLTTAVLLAAISHQF